MCPEIKKSQRKFGCFDYQYQLPYETQSAFLLMFSIAANRKQ